MISNAAKTLALAAATIAIAAPLLTAPAEAQTYKIVNAANPGQTFVVECATRPQKSLKWIALNCKRTQAGAKGGNVEFEWKVEEGKS